MAPPPAAGRVTRSQLHKQQQQSASSSSAKYVKTGECSTPYYVPMVKPKFHSDTVEFQERLDYEASFDYYGKRKSHKKKQEANDHEYSRMRRSIFGNGHVTDKTFEPGAFRFPAKPSKSSMRQYIQDHQQQYFQQLKHQRECLDKSKREQCTGDVRMPFTVSNQEQVESLLNTSFPNWHTFSSCVVLLQLIFDKNRPVDSSNKQWTDKYRPRHLNGLLGERHNYRYLHDWLHQMKIEPLSAPRSTTDTAKKRRKKKHKKLVMQHDADFDDEEAFLKSLSLYEDEQDEDFTVRPGGSSRKELKKESMRSNIILLVGDHGIGKTASVYTIAEQMDYEVFEINAGSKRSGKDIMSAVGEMTKSHLVAFGIAPPASAGSLFLEKTTSNNKPKPGRPKKKLNPSLQSPLSTATTTSKPSSLKDFLVKKKPAAAATSNASLIAPPTTKQSLILLEEVDLLFEEDKGFWAAVIELSQKSKRPIIMTCNGK